ncbi:hypothetical protein [Runella sp.]|uniref:hypothetical protein n=1 Tax=Runella sp. TaxID=1960881 RepID=UPI003D149FB6
MALTASYSHFWILTDIAGLYGLKAPDFRKECIKRGIALKSAKQKYSPKEVDSIIEVLGKPRSVHEVVKSG